MTKFFSASEHSNFRALGWDVCGSSAYVHFDALALGIHIEADGELMIQSACEDGKWRWVYGARTESPLIAACVAADFFYAKTGWELLSARGQGRQ